MTPLEEVTAVRGQLWDAGFRPVPVHNAIVGDNTSGKNPLGNQWQISARKDPPLCTVALAVAHAVNTGILADGLRPIDFDIDDPDTARACRDVALQMFGEAPLRIRQGSPRCLLLYRAAAGEPTKLSITGSAHAKGNACKIEVLGKGQQFVAFGLHYSGAMLQWFPETPGGEKRDNLTALTEDQIQAFLVACAQIIDAPSPIKPNGKGPHVPGDLQADALRIAAALAEIPNDGPADWETWNRVCMAVWAAVGGAEVGRDLILAWSARNPAYDPQETSRRWDHYRTSPPTHIGAGTIFFLAQEARRAREPQPDAPHPAEVFPEPDVDQSLELITEDSVALTFLATHKDKLRFNHDAGAWFLWDGWVWHRQPTKLAYHWARERARLMSLDHGNVRSRLAAGKASFAGGVERFAQADPTFAVTNAIWNADPFLLGTPRGTVDLRTGYLTEPKQDDFISRKTSVVPSEEEDCPRFLEFLEQITQKDKEVIGFLKRWFGYCLTGDTREHALLFAWGAGGNGKGVLMNTVYQIMGEYAASAPMDTFTERKYATHTTDLAMLAGARLVLTSEIDEGAAWAEAKLKQLTGGDPITARFMRRDNFTYLPVFKVNISGNHKPAFSSVDDAMRRRLTMVPFLFKPEHPDRSLPDRLKAEYPGILRWMITGCLDWQCHGLSQPASVIEATKEYFAAQDFFHRWLDECCTLGQGQVANGVLLKSFQQWCASNGEEVKDNKALRGMLEKHPGIKCVMIHGKRFVQGIALKPPEDDPRAPTDEMWQR